VVLNIGRACVRDMITASRETESGSETWRACVRACVTCPERAERRRRQGWRRGGCYNGLNLTLDGARVVVCWLAVHNQNLGWEFNKVEAYSEYVEPACESEGRAKGGTECGVR
jgi:hypothetical protein